MDSNIKEALKESVKYPAHRVMCESNVNDSANVSYIVSNSLGKRLFRVDQTVEYNRKKHRRISDFSMTVYTAQQPTVFAGPDEQDDILSIFNACRARLELAVAQPDITNPIVKFLKQNQR